MDFVQHPTADSVSERYADKSGDRFIFFFQAEDGIRDVAVTGVQTCALPIYSCLSPSGIITTVAGRDKSGYSGDGGQATRSEERRVGKEWRRRQSRAP